MVRMAPRATSGPAVVWGGALADWSATAASSAGGVAVSGAAGGDGAANGLVKFAGSARTVAVGACTGATGAGGGRGGGTFSGVAMKPSTLKTALGLHTARLSAHTRPTICLRGVAFQKRSLPGATAKAASQTGMASRHPKRQSDRDSHMESYGGSRPGKHG